VFGAWILMIDLSSMLLHELQGNTASMFLGHDIRILNHINGPHPLAQQL